MKKICFILVFGLLLSTVVLGQQKEGNSIIGMWQLGKAINNGHEANINKIVQLKQYLANGDFQVFVSTGPGKTFQTMKGTYQVKNDTVYSETIQTAINPGMVGRTYDILYKLNDTQLDLDGKVTIPNANDQSVIDTFSYNEKWNKVEHINTAMKKQPAKN